MTPQQADAFKTAVAWLIANGAAPVTDLTGQSRGTRERPHSQRHRHRVRARQLPRRLSDNTGRVRPRPRRTVITPLQEGHPPHMATIRVINYPDVTVVTEYDCVTLAVGDKEAALYVHEARAVRKALKRAIREAESR